MFAYIDPTIRKRLVDSGQLFRIDARGQRIEVNGLAPDSDFTLNVLGPVPLPIELDEVVTFQWYAFVRHTQLTKAEEIAAAVRHRGDRRLLPLLSAYMAVNSILILGDLSTVRSPLIRVHSSCLTGDVLGSKRCECGPQLDAALERIANDPSGAGALVYMSGHEGRGIGLWAKAITYLLQDSGQDTYQANRSLGLPDDSRDFSDAAAILLHFLGGDRPFRLMSNNPKKYSDLKDNGLTKFDVQKHVVGVNPWNRRYLSAKREWGHTFLPTDIEEAG